MPGVGIRIGVARPGKVGGGGIPAVLSDGNTVA